MGKVSGTNSVNFNMALRYAKRGIPVFAVVGTGPNGKLPVQSNQAWSRYLGRDIQKGQGGFHRATTDPEIIEWMFSWRNARGIGIPTGKASGIIVADFDIHKEASGGNAHQRLLEFEDAIEATHRVRTRNGGLHAYFRWRPGHGKHELGENIDVQTDGSYVLVPPTEGYCVEKLVFTEDWDCPPWEPIGSVARTLARADMGLREVTEDILALRDKIYADGGGSIDFEYEEGGWFDHDEINLDARRQSLINPGGWHNAMVRLTAHLVGSGWSDAQILRFIPEWTSAGYTHVQTFHEVATAIAGARSKWATPVEAIKRAVPALKEEQLRDLHRALGAMIGERE